MTKIEEFDLLLSDYNKIEEYSFLKNIKDFAEKNKKFIIRAFSLLFKDKHINIQLKFLIIKSIGELKYIEFIPLTSTTSPSNVVTRFHANLGRHTQLKRVFTCLFI